MRNSLQLSGEPLAYSSQGFGRIMRRQPLRLVAARPAIAAQPARRARSGKASSSADDYHLARDYRSRQVAAMVARALQLLGRLARRVIARSGQREQIRATGRALRGLDERSLRDLGFDRREIWSIAAEAAGAIDSTRVRVLTSARALGL